MKRPLRLDEQLLNTLSEQARSNPRLRMNYDLRDSTSDGSQRMLNALEPGTVLPIHRHPTTSEVVVLLRGSIRQNIYDDSGRLTDSFIVEPGSSLPGFSLPAGTWHNTESLQTGTVLLECKEGPYAPLTDEDILVP